MNNLLFWVLTFAKWKVTTLNKMWPEKTFRKCKLVIHIPNTVFVILNCILSCLNDVEEPGIITGQWLIFFWIASNVKHKRWVMRSVEPLITETNKATALSSWLPLGCCVAHFPDCSI